MIFSGAYTKKLALSFYIVSIVLKVEHFLMQSIINAFVNNIHSLMYLR